MAQLPNDIPRFPEPKPRNPGSSHRLGGLTLIDCRADGTLKQATGKVITGFDIPEFPSPDITHRPPGWLSKLAGQEQTSWVAFRSRSIA